MIIFVVVTDTPLHSAFSISNLECERSLSCFRHVSQNAVYLTFFWLAGLSVSVSVSRVCPNRVCVCRVNIHDAYFNLYFATCE